MRPPNAALPKAVLLDLDDTILDDSGPIDRSWQTACERYCTDDLAVTPTALHAAIRQASEWYWSDAERHRLGRLAMTAARTDVVRLALRALEIENESLATRVALSYARDREAAITELPRAVETVRWLRARGCRLALLTNGAADAQRRKIVRFELTGLFEEIFVEGEVGFGKPDERIYELALQKLDTRPEDSWMVGDNLEWDVAAPQRLGLSGIWIDRHGRGLPPGALVRPDRTVRALSDLQDTAMK